MATLIVKVPRYQNWSLNDRLQLVLGSPAPGSADLAHSSPAGGQAVLSVAPWERDEQKTAYGLGEGELGFDALGVNEPPRVELSVTRTQVSANKLANLPVGVSSIDMAGNVSSVLEQSAELYDLPAGVGPVTVAPVMVSDVQVPGVLISWPLSSDVY